MNLFPFLPFFPSLLCWSAFQAARACFLHTKQQLFFMQKALCFMIKILYSSSHQSLFYEKQFW
jgi:hypothetical protein